MILENIIYDDEKLTKICWWNIVLFAHLKFSRAFIEIRETILKFNRFHPLFTVRSRDFYTLFERNFQVQSNNNARTYS